jgi:hypothetical protein
MLIGQHPGFLSLGQRPQPPASCPAARGRQSNRKKQRVGHANLRG